MLCLSWTDIDELSNVHPCTGSCNNMEGSYECTCPQGSKGDGKPRKTKISDKFPYPAGVAICKYFFWILQQMKAFTVEKYSLSVLMSAKD